jgi:hypothetical protein
MNGYVGFYRGKRFEVQSDSTYHAQMLIAKQYKIKKTWEITIMLAEKDGEPVVHTATD